MSINSSAHFLVQPLRSCYCMILCLTLVTAGYPAIADDYLDDVHLSYMRSVEKSLLNENFSQADSLNRQFINDYPTDPAGYLFRAATLLGIMSEREENLQSNIFAALIDTVLDLAAPDSSRSLSERLWMTLFRGHALIYRAVWETEFGSRLAGIRTAYAASAEYENGLALDDSFYDFYLGLGSFHYWKSAKAGILRRLHLVRNEKQKGIRELRLAVDSSKVSSASARNALIWIWIDCKEYDSAITLCRQMLSAFPDGKIFYWPMAEASYKKKDHTSALAAYRELRRRLQDDPGNYLNLIQCDDRIFDCLNQLGKNDEAILAARQVLHYHKLIPEETKKKRRKEIARLLRASG